MRFKDMPVGAAFTLGYLQYFGSLNWIKVNSLFAMAYTPVTHRDYNARSDQATNFYPDTSLHHWLNDEAGFLSSFSAEERAVLRPYMINTAVPRRLRKEKGVVHSTTCFAALPCASQLIDGLERYHNVPIESSAFDKVQARTVCTRTACGDKSFYRTDSYGGPARISQDAHISVHPVICIDPDAQFWDEGNGYRLVPKAPVVDQDFLFSLVTNF